jgi:predicted nucleic acid-binding protein
MEEIKGGLVVDSNIIFSALISKSRTREILQKPFLFIAPKYALREIDAHLPIVIRKCSRRNVSEKEVRFAYDTILSNIIFIPDESYKPRMREAISLVGEIDEKDFPYGVMIKP